MQLWNSWFRFWGRGRHGIGVFFLCHDYECNPWFTITIPSKFLSYLNSQITTKIGDNALHKMSQKASISYSFHVFSQKPISQNLKLKPSIPNINDEWKKMIYYHLLKNKNKIPITLKPRNHRNRRNLFHIR